MEIRAGKLRIRQERVLSAGECQGIIDALVPELVPSRFASRRLAMIEDGALPYSPHLRAMVARFAEVDALEHQELWTGVRCARYDHQGPGVALSSEVPELEGRRTHGALLYLSDGAGGETEFPGAGLTITPEAGVLIVWTVGAGHELAPLAEPVWSLTTWVRSEPAPDPSEEITVRRSVVSLVPSA